MNERTSENDSCSAWNTDVNERKEREQEYGKEEMQKAAPTVMFGCTAISEDMKELWELPRYMELKLFLKRAGASSL